MLRQHYMKTYLMLFLLILTPILGTSQTIPKLEFYQYKPTTPDRSDLFETMKYINEIERIEFEKKREEEKKRISDRMIQTKNIYLSFNTFPAIITDGWHSIIATNNTDFCNERKVYVRENRIIKYVIDNWLEREVLFSAVISQGKGVIKTKISETENNYLEIYFLDFCLNQNYTSTPPIKPGKITFWTNWKRSGPIRIYIGGFEIGIISKYYKDVPTCEKEGTVTFTYKPGTYDYEAIGLSIFGQEIKWKGHITLKENTCLMQALSKR